MTRAEMKVLAKFSPSPLAQLKVLTDYFQGEAEAIRFMRAFACNWLLIPPMPVIEEMLKMRRVADSIHDDPSLANAYRLCNFYGVSLSEVRESYKRLHGTSVTERRRQIAIAEEEKHISEADLDAIEPPIGQEYFERVAV